MASPVSLSHIKVVSLWLVIPIEAMSEGERLFFSINLLVTLKTESQISLGSCSTQPSFGKLCLNSLCSMLIKVKSFLKRIARELVVPWSIEIIFLFIC